MRGSISMLATCIATAVILGCGKDNPTKPPSPAPQSRIVFQSERDGNAEIYIINADGTGQRRLTFSDTTSDASPSWYPDGRHIVFVKSWQGCSALYRINDDGTGPVCIDSTFTGSYYAPRISPDGMKVVYSFGDENGEHIWVMDADGSSPVQVTNTPGMDRHPDWSPDGARIVFAREAPNSSDRIFTMRSDGADTLMLAPSYPAFQSEPRWSPDGGKIAFTGQSGPGYTAIFVMNTDGSLGAPLTIVDTKSQSGPCWSPDGSRIAFSILQQQGFDLYEVSRDGRGFVRVTNVPGGNYQPDWGKPIPF